MDAPNPSDDRLARLRRRLADRFDFLALLGEGGGGAVFEVHNRRLDRIEALKVLTSAFEDLGARRFEHEARILASLDHPRIVKIYEFGQDAGLPWYSMQFVDGPSLAALLETSFRFDLARVAGLLMPLLDALDYSHGQGIVHRDIKPANILLNRQGRPFLSDFGIAKSRESVHQTRTGQMLGTPAYVAPEQALGEAVDARADQYSLAITVYRVLAGRLPFASDNVLQTVVQRLKEPPEPIRTHRPDLPEALGAVLMRDALQQVCAEAGIPWHEPLPGLESFPVPRLPLAAEAGPGEPRAEAGYAQTIDLPSRRRRRSRALAAILAVAVVGLAGAGLAWRGRRPPPVVPAAKAETKAPAAEPASKAAVVLASPAPPARPAPARSPAAEPDGPRRPLTYPQLETEPAQAPPPAGCAGLSAPVSLQVGEDGRVLGCRFLKKEVPAECRKAVEAVALGLRFRPALDGQGRPVATSFATSITLLEAP